MELSLDLAYRREHKPLLFIRLTFIKFLFFDFCLYLYIEALERLC